MKKIFIFDVVPHQLLCNALVYPSLDYNCVSVWGKASKMWLCDGKTNQKQGLRLMHGADRRANCVKFFMDIYTLFIIDLYSYMFLISYFNSLNGLGGVDIYTVKNICIICIFFKSEI